MQGSLFVIALVVCARLIIVLCLEVYHEMNRVTFHSLSQTEGLLKASKHGNKGQGMVFLTLKNPSIKKSRGDHGLLIRLHVLERVRMSETKKGFINFYKVESTVGGKKTSTVEKSYQEFKIFEKTLINFLRGSVLDYPTLDQGLKTAGIQPSSGEREIFSGAEHRDSVLTKQEELYNIKRYCGLLTSNQEFQVGPFFEFFKISGVALVEEQDANENSIDYQEALNKSRSESCISMGGGQGQQHFQVSPMLLPSAIQQPRGDDNLRQLSLAKWQMFSSDDSTKFCTYFTIKLEEFCKVGDHHTFRFKVLSNISEDFKVIIEKRYSDFLKLEGQLKKYVKSRSPALPRKTIIHTDAALLDRGHKLEEWLNIVSNDKLFHTKDLFTFLQVSDAFATVILDLPMISNVYSVACRVISHTSVNTQDENFLVYNMKVEVFDKQTKERISEHLVGRRFREFVALHETLKRMFSEFKTPLPELPSRLTPFVSTETREQQIDTYLSKLLTYEGVLEVLVFRKFINLESAIIRDSVPSNLLMLA